jgi:sporulation-control protein spo0M
MVKNITVVVYSDPHQPFYYPGSDVKGAVTVSTDTPKDYDRIVVKLYGRADVQWTEGSGDNSTTYSNNVTYIKQRYILWSKENSPVGELPMGEHTFPFQYQLPQNIPPSFEGIVGRVRYEIRAKVVRIGLLKANHRASTFLAVREHAELMRLCVEPQMCDKSSRVSCLCFNFGSINMTCNVPRTGFSPGDAIPLSAHIENLTTKIIYIQALLKRYDIYIARGGNKNRPRKQYRLVNSPSIQAGEITSFDTHQSLKIPEEVPATLKSCSCISVEYALVIRAVIPMAPNVKVKIPIVVQPDS